MPVSDLLYMEEKEYLDQIQSELLAEFPTAKFEDGSDDIHRYRFSVDIENLEQQDWYLWLLRKGWFQFSFDFQFVTMDRPHEVKPLMQQVLKERGIIP